jgi:beta-lactamase regulating signal transducer with metallopeptidase domain
MNIDGVIRGVFAVASDHPLLERLFVASLELIAVTVLVLAIIRVARLKSNRVVSLLWLIAMIKPILSLAFAAPAPVFNYGSLGVLPAIAQVETAGENTRPLRSTAEVTAATGTSTVTATVGATSMMSLFAMIDPARVLFGAWLAGVGMLSLLAVTGRLRIRRLAREATSPSPLIQALYRDAADGMQTKRLPRLLVTDQLESPAIAGTFFPVVFLPAWMARTPDPERVVWSLRHELTHWRHRDHVAGFVGEVARILFFFHPLVWWVGQKWKVATEIACDQAMVGTRNDAQRYAKQLYEILTRVHTRRRIMLANGLFATRTQIGKRIEILLKSRPRRTGRRLPAVVFLFVFTALVFSLGTEISPVAKSRSKRIAVKADDAKPSSVTTMIDEDGRTITIVSKGDVEFNDGNINIESISPDGSFNVTEVRDGVERELEVNSAEDDGLEWVYKVDGKIKPYDDDAREWFEGLMKYVQFDLDEGVLMITKPRFTLSKPLVITDKPHLKVRIAEPSEIIEVYKDDDIESSVELTLKDDEDDVDVWISTKGKIRKLPGEHVVLGITQTGKILISVKKDGDKHELEVIPGDDKPEYVYKLNGAVRPYDDDAKKIFEKYITKLEDGFELHTGERI